MLDPKYNLNIHLYTGNGFLLPFKSEIEHSAADILEKVLTKLPISDVDVEIYAGDLQHAPEAGIIGHTENLHHITIALMPHHPNFSNILSNDLLKTIAHELHHIARWRALKIDKTFFDSLISEGLAGHFETELFGGKPGQSFRSLTQEQVALLLPIAEKEFTSKEYDHFAWFSGSEEKHIPRWAGYGIGYFIVEKYLLNHPSEKASSLYNTTSDVFL